MSRVDAPLGTDGQPLVPLRVSTAVTTTAEDSSVRCTGRLVHDFDDLRP
jgi:hypothetical protein